MRSRNILLLSGNITNLGDELMLRAVVRRLNLAGLRLVYSYRGGNHDQLTDLRLRPLLDSGRRGSMYNLIGYPTIKRYRSSFGLIDYKDVDCIVDLRGFHIGDQWGDGGVKQKAEQLISAKSEGKKVIILPQAYGPFSSEFRRTWARKYVEAADKFFVRDNSSKNYLLSTGLPEGKIRIVRDLTLPEKGGCPPVGDYPITQPYFCVVPNKWMLERAGAADRENYIDWLVSLSDYARSAGMQSILLIYGGALDEQVKRLLCQRSAEFVCVIPKKPSDAKWIVEGANFLIVSRYHALIAALSCGIPVVCTAWSHKYVAACEDFGVREFVSNPSDGVASAKRLLDRLIDDVQRNEISLTIKSYAQQRIADVEAMWGEVLTFVES